MSTQQHNLLHSAAKAGSICDLNVLVKDGIDVNMYFETGDTALHVSAMCGHYNMCDRLIKLGADVKAKNSMTSVTPLNKTARARMVANQCVVVLEDYYADSQSSQPEDLDGATPLHYAAANPHNELICELLIRQGADVNAQDETGATPLDYATWYKGEHNCPTLTKSGGLRNRTPGCPSQDYNK